MDGDDDVSRRSTNKPITILCEEAMRTLNEQSWQVSYLLTDVLVTPTGATCEKTEIEEIVCVCFCCENEQGGHVFIGQVKQGGGQACACDLCVSQLHGSELSRPGQICEAHITITFLMGFQIS